MRRPVRTMQAEGFALVNAGITTFEEVQRTVYAPLDEMVFDEAASGLREDTFDPTDAPANGTAHAHDDNPAHADENTKVGAAQ